MQWLPKKAADAGQGTPIYKDTEFARVETERVSGTGLPAVVDGLVQRPIYAVVTWAQRPAARVRTAFPSRRGAAHLARNKNVTTHHRVESVS